jgi:cell division protease FtsH
MNSNFQKLAIWVAILVLLAALFNLFNNSTPSRRGNEITYSEFLTAVDAGNVSEATLAGNHIYGTMRDGGTAFSTYAPPQDPTLVERLQKKDVKFRARPS